MGAALIILAAGLGTRYGGGGVKQVERIGPNGEILADYNVYDAVKAGFDKVIFVIKRDMREDFEKNISGRISRHVETELVYQGLGDIPEGYAVPKGRIKPWGTGHAALLGGSSVAGPTRGDGRCAIIYADDFYGRSAFEALYGGLSEPEEGGVYGYCTVGYRLKDTISEAGYVSRGVCAVEAGYLRDVTEYTKIIKRPEGIYYMDCNGVHRPISPETVVSMGCWGVRHSFFAEARRQFAGFLSGLDSETRLGKEFYLPDIIKTLLVNQKARVRVMETKDRWLGFTYREDKPAVAEAIGRLIEGGQYPERLWPV